MTSPRRAAPGRECFAPRGYEPAGADGRHQGDSGSPPKDEAAREWFESQIWPKGPYCPYCGSDNVQSNIRHRSMTHRCRACDDTPRFSLKPTNDNERGAACVPSRPA